MMNLQSTQPIQSIEPQLPTSLPQIPIDPTNPLSWVLVLTLFLGTTEKPINATASLIRAIAALRVTIAKTQRAAKQIPQESRRRK
ncbi:hypothetical protein [Phormidesmis sp. 146-33]